MGRYWLVLLPFFTCHAKVWWAHARFCVCGQCTRLEAFTLIQRRFSANSRFHPLDPSLSSVNRSPVCWLNVNPLVPRAALMTWANGRRKYRMCLFFIFFITVSAQICDPSCIGPHSPFLRPFGTPLDCLSWHRTENRRSKWHWRFFVQAIWLFSNLVFFPLWSKYRFINLRNRVHSSPG